MADDRIWTAAELERLTIEERYRLVSEGLVTDLSVLDPDFVARVRATGRALLEERGLVARQGDA